MGGCRRRGSLWKNSGGTVGVGVRGVSVWKGRGEQLCGWNVGGLTKNSV